MKKISNVSRQVFNLLFFTIIALVSIPLASKSPAHRKPIDITKRLNTLSQLNNTTIDKETFETGMIQQRKVTEQIGFCIQQILQTINAKKIHLSKKDQIHTITELQTLQDFVKTILEKLFVQTSPAVLNDAIITNHILINYLLTTIDNDLSKINTSTFLALFQKRSMIPLSAQRLHEISLSNKKKIQELVLKSDSIGLTWYNSTYRALKNYNAYSVTKGVAIAAASVVILAYISAHCQYLLPTDITDSDSWKKWIGPLPKYDQFGVYVLPDNPTPITSLISTINSLERGKIISLSALVTISLKDVFSTLYQAPAHWLLEKANEKVHILDQKLQGTAKANIDDFGYEKVYFKDMVGCAELERLARKIASFMKHPERYERAQIEEHRGILLYGPPQTGKSYFAKALRTLIEDELGNQGKVRFIDAKQLFDRGYPIKYIFMEAQFYAPCILFFDEIDLVGTHRDKDAFSTSQLLTCMQGIDNTSKQIFVIGATNRPDQLDQALLVDGRFGKRIYVKYPEYEDRKAYLMQQLAKRSITNLSSEFIDCMAQETENCSFNNLKRIITEAIIQSSIETRPIQQKDFEQALDGEIRKIQAPEKLSETDKEIVAIYQASKAVARHVLHSRQDVIKITINPVIKDVKTAEAVCTIKTDTGQTPENEKFAARKKEQITKWGEVFTKTKSNFSDLISDDQQKQEALALLAGNAGLQLLLNKSYTQCNKQDRAEAMQIIYAMLLGGEKIDDKVKQQALQIKDTYEKEILTLLAPYKDKIQTIAKLLVKQNTIDRYEWKKLIE